MMLRCHGWASGFPGRTPTPVGWLRYSLDQRHIPYIYVRDEDIRAGKLHDKYDVLLYPHVDLELAEQIEGLHKAWGPMPFKKTARRRASARRRPPMTSPAASARAGLPSCRIHRCGRTADHARQRLDAAAGGRAVRGVRREAGGVPRSTQGGGAAAAAASQIAVTRTRARMSVSPSRGRSIRSPMAIRRTHGCSGRTSRSIDPAALAAHGVLHGLPRWADRSQRHRARVGRQRKGRRSWSAARRGVRRISSGGRDSRHAGRQGARDHVQLQSAAPGSQSRRSAHAVERDHQLAGDPRRGAPG